MEKNDKPGAQGGNGTSGEGSAQAAGPSESSAATDTETSTRYLAVSSTRDGFRRAGRAWSTRPEVVKESDFTDEQLTQLDTCANMVVLPCSRQGVRIDLIGAAGPELMLPGDLVGKIDPAPENEGAQP